MISQVRLDEPLLNNLEVDNADAADLLGLNRDFIAEEVVAKVEYNHVNVGLNTAYDRSNFFQKQENSLDSVAHDLKYNSNNEPVDFVLNIGHRVDQLDLLELKVYMDIITQVPCQ